MLIAANSEPLFARLMETMGRPELKDDPRYRGNLSRVEHARELDELIGAWTAGFALPALEEVLTSADIPSSRVYTAADAASDPQYLDRQMVREVEDPLLGTMLHSGIVPHVPEGPGDVRWTGPTIGQHSEAILQELGLTDPEIKRLKNERVIA